MCLRVYVCLVLIVRFYCLFIRCFFRSRSHHNKRGSFSGPMFGFAVWPERAFYRHLSSPVIFTNTRRPTKYYSPPLRSPGVDSSHQNIPYRWNRCAQRLPNSDSESESAEMRTALSILYDAEGITTSNTKLHSVRITHTTIEASFFASFSVIASTNR